MQKVCSTDPAVNSFSQVDECKRDVNAAAVNGFARFQEMLEQLAGLCLARCVEQARLAAKERAEAFATATADGYDLQGDRCLRFRELLDQLAAEYMDLCNENARLANDSTKRAVQEMLTIHGLSLESRFAASQKIDLEDTLVDSGKPDDWPELDVMDSPIQGQSIDLAQDSNQPQEAEEEKNKVQSQFALKTKSFIKEDAEPVKDFLADEEPLPSTSSWTMRFFGTDPGNSAIIRGSALGLRKSLQCAVWLVAFAGVAFVLWASAVKLGAPADVEHRRHLGAGASDMLKHIAYALTGAGLMAIMMNSLKQPLILGYLLGGVLVGPEMGLGLVGDHNDISQISSLGLIFLLFMIGLELNVMELLRMGKVVLTTGALQFPVCVGVMLVAFMGFNALGLSFGDGDYSTLYCGLTCGISSTMIVVKLLSQKGETESRAGRLTVGILIFQDIWAIIVLAIQPNITNPEILGILKTLAWIAVLIVVAMSYAKFVMPAVFVFASKNVELMLVLSLSWCFFMCCFAILPFVGLSMELAALVAGVTLAAFPYSAEFNGKIKYIRDFFITLFFVALGMQVPIPTFDAILKGLLVACVAVIVRWFGICFVVLLMGGGPRLAVLSTLNLSQISEFALVICKLGQDYGHIDEDTMTVIMWTFAILAVSASYIIGFNQAIFKFINGNSRLITRQLSPVGDDEEDRNVVLLGFHRVAFELVSECQRNSPQMLKKMHVIDVDSAIMPRLRDKGIKCSYGDISSIDVLEHLHYGGEETLIISTIPDSVLQGVTNAQLLRVAQHVFPKAHYICSADNPAQAKQLYAAGAHYVLGMAKLSAERLHDMFSLHYAQAFGAGELFDIFESYRAKDSDRRGRSGSMLGEL